MASKQKGRAQKKKERAPNPVVDLGMFQIPNFDEMDQDDDLDNTDVNDLESELEALLAGETGSKPARRRKKKAAAPPTPLSIEQLAAECLKDISDESDSESLDDPELLKELTSLTTNEEESPPEPTIAQIGTMKQEELPVSSQKSPEGVNVLSLLEERLKSYNEALSAAKALGDKSKERRYSRGIKTLEVLLKAAKQGKPVNMEDIPPMVSIPKQKAAVPETPQAIVPPASTSTDDTLIPQKKGLDGSIERLLKSRRQKYKMKALEAKHAGDKSAAMEFMKIIKTLDGLIESNELVDISMIPPSPTEHKDPSRKKQEITQEETQTSSLLAAALAAASEPENPSLSGPPEPTDIIAALEERMQVFISTKSAAEAEGNSGKVRRIQRVIKTYEQALKDYKAGKTVNFEELAVPYGFQPIPNPIEKPSIPPVPPKKPEEPSKRPLPHPEVPSKNATQPQQKPKPKVQRTNTLADRELQFLLERQRLFREAALDAKKNGNLDKAKEYLKMSKGFDSMIEATKCGLPIDKSEIPTPPQLAISDDFVIIDRSDCTDENVDSDSDLFDILQRDLSKQIELCKNNKEHFLKLGDVSSASKFEKLALESQKDLKIIYHMKKAGQPPPKFHYETRIFSIVRCNSDLSDDQLELTVERGVNLPGDPDYLDSFIKIEFPIPNDSPQKAKTSVVRNTNNPIFQEEFKFTINRKSRTQLRQFKRHNLKLEVFSKGRFLRSDSLLGTVTIKLNELETRCTLHDSFDLMDGRKMAGGKLECKVRIRQPLVAKEVEQVQEKWLVIGN